MSSESSVPQENSINLPQIDYMYCRFYRRNPSKGSCFRVVDVYADRKGRQYVSVRDCNLHGHMHGRVYEVDVSRIMKDRYVVLVGKVEDRTLKPFAGNLRTVISSLQQNGEGNEH